jgi:glycosyltransferase involved in cell wall biosynthesis
MERLLHSEDAMSVEGEAVTGQAAEDLPLVTVAIPCLNEERHIEGVVRGALAQDYPRERLEVIVADGGSNDQTLAILARIAAEDARLTVIDNPRRIQAAAMNEIIRRARGEVVVRLDAHCAYAQDYLRSCVGVLARTGADNVGGAQRPRAESRFQRALCAALDSPLGVGGADYRSAEREGFVDTVFCGAFRRRVFETVGMFDPGAITNEDAELNQRILAAGGRVYLSRDIVAHYYPRDSFRALAKQYFRYGKGRARTLLKHKTFPTPRPLVPFLSLLGGAALLTISTLRPLRLPAFAGYGLVCAIEALRVGRKAGLDALPVVWAIFPVLHVSHGVGFAAGLVHYLWRPDWSEAERLTAS